MSNGILMPLRTIWNPWRRSGPAVFVMYLLMALFDTTSRALGGRTEPRLAPRSGDLTPPRISPSCPHCLRLWLGRGTIVGGRGHCETACQGCFWMDGDRWAPCLAVFDSREGIHCDPSSAAGGLGASSNVAQASLPGACRQRTYPVAGCDRKPRCLSKSRERLILSAPYHNF